MNYNLSHRLNKDKALSFDFKISTCICFHSAYSPTAQFEREMQRATTMPYVLSEDPCHFARPPGSHSAEPGHSRQGSSAYRSEVPLPNSRNGFLCESTDHVSLCQTK